MDSVGKKTLEIMQAAPLYNKWLLSLLRPHLKGSILEIGAGIGNFTPLLSKYGQVTAIDIEKFYIKKLKRVLNAKSAGFGDIQRGEYYFGERKFDCIVCLNVLEHIEDDQKAIDNMYKLLKKGGVLLLLVPSHQFAYTPMDRALGHFRRYTKRTLAKLAKQAGFRIIKIRYYNLPGLLGWFVNGKILRKKIIPKGQLGLFDKLSWPWLMMEKKVKVPMGLSVFIVAIKK